MTVKPRIMVGVDNSAGATAALSWAAQRAQANDWQLDAVFVMGAERSYGPSAHRRQGLDDDLRVLAVDRILQRCPTDDCTIRIIDAQARGGLVRALRRASAGAEVLVIGQADAELHRNLGRDLAAPGGCPVVIVNLDGSSHWLTGDPVLVEDW